MFAFPMRPPPKIEDRSIVLATFDDFKIERKQNRKVNAELFTVIPKNDASDEEGLEVQEGRGSVAICHMRVIQIRRGSGRLFESQKHFNETVIANLL
jgi:hypothetical protein